MNTAWLVERRPWFWESLFKMFVYKWSDRERLIT